MENKLELRVGDVVRLKPATVFMTFLDGDFQIEGCDGFLKPDMVESIISRAETDAEKIARLEQANRMLEARIKDLEASENNPFTRKNLANRGFLA